MFFLPQKRGAVMLRALFFAVFVHASIFAGIPVQETYLSPTEQLIKRESWKKIEKELKKIKIPMDLIPFFNQIAEREEWGHIGYHGATQDFRIYQDIIRITLEEVLGIYVRDDFEFFRIPGDAELDLNSMDEFIDYWGKRIDNKHRLRAKQLLALNYSIYSNFDHKGSSSISLFVKDKSKSELDYAKMLHPLYQDLGMPTAALKELFKIAHTWLDGEVGILIRVWESSHNFDTQGEAYNFADDQCYPCERGGYRYGKHLISLEFERIMSDEYVSHDVKIAPQLRLLLNNKHTLNPFSSLHVERFDFYDSETIRSYEGELREYIRSLEFNPELVENYRNYLLEIWSGQ